MLGFTIQAIEKKSVLEFSKLDEDSQEELLASYGDEISESRFFRYDGILFPIQNLKVMEKDFRFNLPIFKNEYPTHWGKYQSVTGKNYYIIIRELENKVIAGKVNYY